LLLVQYRRFILRSSKARPKRRGAGRDREPLRPLRESFLSGIGPISEAKLRPATRAIRVRKKIIRQRTSYVCVRWLRFPRPLKRHSNVSVTQKSDGNSEPTALRQSIVSMAFVCEGSLSPLALFRRPAGSKVLLPAPDGATDRNNLSRRKLSLHRQKKMLFAVVPLRFLQAARFFPGQYRVACDPRATRSRNCCVLDQSPARRSTSSLAVPRSPLDAATALLAPLRLPGACFNEPQYFHFSQSDYLPKRGHFALQRNTIIFLFSASAEGPLLKRG